ncbi:dihydrofolate reductase family protein [Metabacillus sp. RGM 3146]|uniref:dihydrofolate reductase family protein n=1 Tax=Metabacillus sp. RGM 3146 TaxID=3401092 RepID=UPI003B9D4B19
MAREIVLFIAVSLDGFIAKEDGDLNWLFETEGEGDNGYSDMYQAIDTMIMGKKTYDYVRSVTETFPHSDRKCYVFSSSTQGSDEHAEFVNDDVLAFVTKLKEQEGSKIWMVGGSDLLDSFMKEKLIDEFIITITPHILGSGIPLFKENNPQFNLILQGIRQFGQFAEVRYKVKE